VLISLDGEEAYIPGNDGIRPQLCHEYSVQDFIPVTYAVAKTVQIETRES